MDLEVWLDKEGFVGARHPLQFDLDDRRFEAADEAWSEQVVRLDRLSQVLDDMGIRFNRSATGARALGTSFVEGPEPGVVTRPDPDGLLGDRRGQSETEAAPGSRNDARSVRAS